MQTAQKGITVPTTISSDKDKEDRKSSLKRKASGALSVIVLVIIGFIVICGMALIMHAVGFEPFGRSFLGMVPFWDPDGMSIYERICQLFGW